MTFAVEEEMMLANKEHTKLLLRSTNDLLDLLQELSPIPCGLPNASVIASKLNISRTTANKLIGILSEKGIARVDGNSKLLLRKPVEEDYYSLEEMQNSKADLVERQILQKLSLYEIRPGDRFSELEIAKELQSNTVLVREALFKIAQSGIIKKFPGQKWEVVEFSKPMIREIAAIRKLYEEFAINGLKLCDENAPVWDELKLIYSQHQDLLKKKQISVNELRAIEKAFHTTIVSASNNRFIKQSYGNIFTLIFFHLGQIEYDHEKIIKVLNQHIEVLELLLSKEFDKAKIKMIEHLEHAEQSMREVNQAL